MGMGTRNVCLIGTALVLGCALAQGMGEPVADSPPASWIRSCEYNIPDKERAPATPHDPQEDVCLRLSDDGTHGAVTFITKPKGDIFAIPKLAVAVFNTTQTTPNDLSCVPLEPNFPEEVRRSEPGNCTICRRLQMAWSPDGSTIALIECARGYLWLVSAKDKSIVAEKDLEVLREKRSKPGLISSLAWHPDGRTLFVIGFNGLYTVDTSRRPLIKEECILSLDDVRRFAAPLNPLKLYWNPGDQIVKAGKFPVYFWVSVVDLDIKGGGLRGSMGEEYQFEFMPKERRCVGKPVVSERPPLSNRTLAAVTGRYLAYPFTKVWVEDKNAKSPKFKIIREQVKPCPERGVAITDPEFKSMPFVIPNAFTAHWSQVKERLAVAGISPEGFFIHCYEPHKK